MAAPKIAAKIIPASSDENRSSLSVPETNLVTGSSLNVVEPMGAAASGMRRTRAFLKKTFRRSRLHPRFLGRGQLPELQELEELIAVLDGRIEVEVLARVQARDREFPVYGLSMGSKDPTAPVLGFFGGVHGLERIGTHVVLAYLQTASELMHWDDLFNEKLEKTRIILVPLVNPGGMWMHWRANPNGVDLMRNAPMEASDNTTFLLSGHRYGKWLPWYRGTPGVLEPEAEGLCRFVRKHIAHSKASICVDVHSGFGAVDRLWFPYAKTLKPFPHLPEFYALNQLFDRSYPNHFYKIEPQALSYTTHGDLWDYLYDEHLQTKSKEQIFLPLCLEMGSWSWVRKNPWQMFSALGPFNPLLVHRHQRILRRHYTLFDFLQRAAYSHSTWTELDDHDRRRLEEEARMKWYDK
jgi:hypothetical protein